MTQKGDAMTLLVRSEDAARRPSLESKSLAVQLVIYNASFPTFLRTIQSVVAACSLAQRSGLLSDHVIVIGDSSEAPCLSEEQTASLRRLVQSGGGEYSYRFFGENLGSAEGSNRLAAATSAERLLVLNPDTFVHPRAISGLMEVLDHDRIGIAEGRQLPVEHPKVYDPISGDTPWASGACLMVKRPVFEEVGGFDGLHFFLHCDDVDFSWRVRLAGYRVVHVPRALIFHDKRVDTSGRVQVPDAERYYGLLGRLMLGTRYDRNDIVSATIEQVERSGDPIHLSALSEFRERVADSRIPEVLDAKSAASVAEFVGANYAIHRF